MSESNTEWYWDLHLKKAVPSEDRGPAENLLGPYPSKSAAEHWQDRVDQRNEAWDDADEAWNDDNWDGDKRGENNQGDSGSGSNT